MEERKAFGARFKEFRNDRGLSQAGLAKELRITQEEVSRIENGHAAKLTDRLAHRLNNAFPLLNLDWLVSGGGEMIKVKVSPRRTNDPSEFARAQGLGPNTCVAFKRLCGLSQSEKDAVEKFLTDERIRAIAAIIAGK